MNFNGFTPHEYTRFSSLVEQDDATALPVGVATVARNVTFHLASVRTRDGIQMQFQTPTQDQAITGLASLINQQAGGNTQYLSSSIWVDAFTWSRRLVRASCVR